MILGVADRFGSLFLPWCWAQEPLYGVVHSLDLFHKTVLHLAVIQDSPVCWAGLENKARIILIMAAVHSLEKIDKCRKKYILF